MSKLVSVEDLEYGLSILARIIDTQGDTVWPLFERLEHELEDVRSRRERVSRHMPSKLSGTDSFGRGG